MHESSDSYAAMNWILPEGVWLEFEGLSSPLQILRGLGGGGQGQVFEVAMEGERLALKWYFPSCLNNDPHLSKRLNQNIRATSPNTDFLWPIALLRPTATSQSLIRSKDPGFGYLMALRPDDYVGAMEHYAGRLDISLQNVLRSCFYLAEAFHSLHTRGLCYKDISIGNLFLQPDTGRILICDNDNVDEDGRELGSVLGTAGFIAPEVLMREARPGTNSDLFSLAVLMFRLLMRHDPLKGQKELDIHCLDEPARRRLYGEDPVFIFDPKNNRNRPNPKEHAAALLTWPIYPLLLQQLFLQTFCEGMKNPSRRSLTGQWKDALSGTLDLRQLCPCCGQENFLVRDNSKLSCWECSAPMPDPIIMQAAHGSVVAAAGNELNIHHFDCLESPQLLQPLARVTNHPSDPLIVGLCNLSGTAWTARLSDGKEMKVEPGRNCNLAKIQQISTSAGVVVITH